MNEALRERQANKEFIREYDLYGDRSVKLIEVDTHRVRFHGKRYCKLSGFERRKFENILVIDDPKNKLEIRYKNLDLL